MDAGIASDNIAYRIKQDYHYLVVSRERHVKDPREQETLITAERLQDSRVVVYREVDTETKKKPALLVIRTRNQKRTRHP